MQQGQIFIANLLIQETGTFNDLYSRPYTAQTNNENLDMLSRRLEATARSNQSSSVASSLVTGLATNISAGLVMPAASWERRLTIPNGWNERRLRFILEAHVKRAFNVEIYYLQGYSDHVGISMNGAIDPNMPFYINSYIRVVRSTDYTGTGILRDTVSETAQVIDGQFHVTNAESGLVYTLRPEDLITGIQSNYIKSAMEASVMGTVYDTRTSGLPSVVGSSRSNAIPSNFVANYISGYRRALWSADFGVSSDDVYSRAISEMHEESPYSNPFIRALSNIRGIPNTTQFTMSDIAELDPEAITTGRVRYEPVRDAIALHRAGETEQWDGADLKTQLATLLINSVSGIMVDCMIRNVTFDTTTLTVNGLPLTRIISANSFTNMNISYHYQHFIDRFNSEVVPDITYNGNIALSALLSIDLYGQSTVELSIDGDPSTPYAAPSFCDAIFAPVVTTDANQYHGLVHGMEQINQAIEASAPGISGMNSIIHEV